VGTPTIIENTSGEKTSGVTSSRAVAQKANSKVSENLSFDE
jgi:hypothetical protein